MPARSMLRAAGVLEVHSPARIPQKLPMRMEVQMKRGQARIAPVEPRSEVPMP